MGFVSVAFYHGFEGGVGGCYLCWWSESLSNVVAGRTDEMMGRRELTRIKVSLNIQATSIPIPVVVGLTAGGVIGELCSLS